MYKQYPVVLFVFKRPASTVRFLEIMKESKIKKIYVFADGPRNNAEKFETDVVRENIDKFTKLNPNINIIANYSSVNIGLKKSIVGGLNKVFKTEEAAIIIEDDCLPTSDFFRFAGQMLSKYQNNSSVMSITGTSVGKISQYSYDFSKYQHCWGWATWARAWRLYEADLPSFNTQNWPKLSKSTWDSSIMRFYWYQMLRLTKVGWLDTWDFQWSYSHFINKGLAIYPMVNLISNIGFDSAATHTKKGSSVSSMAVGRLTWPLIHPSRVKENIELSNLMEKKFYKNIIAFLGMFRQYLYWTWSKYVNRY